MPGSTVAMARPVKATRTRPIWPSATARNCGGQPAERAQQRLDLAAPGVRPAGVSSTRRLERTKRGAPRAFSNCAIWRLSAGWATARASAARRKCSWRATSRK